LAGFDIALAQIAPEFAFIEDRGLKQTEGRLEADHGGAAQALCAGRAFSLRFDRDAFGFVTVAAVHPSGQSFPLTEALQFLKVDFADPQQDPATAYASSMNMFRIGLDDYVALYGPPTTVARQAAAAEANWTALVDLFASDGRCASFYVFTQARARKRLDLYASRTKKPQHRRRAPSIWARLTRRAR
jgi:hypothetical protein